MPDRLPGARLRGPYGYAAAGAAAAMLFFAIYALVNHLRGGSANNPSPGASAPSGEGGVNQLRRTSESFRSIAKKVAPAVVNVKATHGSPKARGGGRGPGRRFHRQAPDDEDGFRGGDPFFDFSPRPPQQSEPQVSLGSGILVDKSGIVVTNNHVIEGATEIEIMLYGDDKKEVKAKVIGTDPKTDLAVLRLASGGNYPVAEWADSDAVEVGDWAVAIGSPFALGTSVTLGIISAKGRNAQELMGTYGGDLLQTDAAINPGNSGGPLCDLDGRVMGVNTAIYTRSGGYMGIGFAIPSNSAKEVVGKLIKDGRITRGWLGVYIQPLDPELAKDLGIKEGVQVHEVLEDGPAAKAGLTAGDVIIEADGKTVKESAALQRTISNFKPGQSVKLKIVGYNDKKTRDITVKVGTLPEKEPETGEEKDIEPDKLGLVVSAAPGGGVRVEAIQPGSLADEQLRLEEGDVLLRINRKPVDSLATYKKLLDGAKQIALEVKRKGRTLFFRFTLPE